MACASPDEHELLPLDEEGCPEIVASPPTHGKYFRRLLAGAGTLAAAIVVIVVMAPSSGLSRIQSADAVGLYTAVQTCYTFTGGTCRLSGCASSRHSQCVHRQCLCVGINGCAGVDGKCHSGTNQPVKSNFALKNVKWPSYAMYTQASSTHGQIATTKWGFGGLKYQFNLHKFVGNDAKPHFLMTSSQWPDYANYFAKTGITAVQKYGFYSVKMTDSKGPDELAVSVCYNRHKDAISIGTKDWSHTAYAKHGTWLVYGYGGTFGGVGDSGLWTVEPKLTEWEKNMLPACHV